MITISDKVTTYKVAKEGDNYSFSGELKLNSESELEYLNGVVSNKENNVSGNLYYSVNDSKLNKNISGVLVENESDILEFIDGVISDVKAEIANL